MSMFAVNASSSALIGAVVGAAAGVIGAGLTAFVNSKTQAAEREAQRDQLERDRDSERLERRKAQMLEAALTFATALEWIRSRANFVHIQDLDEAIVALEQRLNEGLAQLGPISLLFGSDSETLDDARLAHFRAIGSISIVRDLAEVSLEDREGHPIALTMGPRMDELKEALGNFTNAAGRAIEQGPRWASDGAVSAAPGN